MQPEIFDDVDGFYNSVISQLLDFGAHPSVLTALKSTSILLMPNVSRATIQSARLVSLILSCVLLGISSYLS